MAVPVRYDIVYTGRVQGVFFRATAEKIARGRPLAGWVRNEPDGSVRCVIEGEPGTLDAFMVALAEAKRGYIEEARLTRQPASGDLSGFQIRRR